MGIMDMFRSQAGNTNSPQMQQPQGPGNQGQQAGQGYIPPPSQGPGGQNNPANAVVPGAAPGTTGSVAANDRGIPKNNDKQALTIDQFNDLWKDPELGEGKSRQSDPSQYRYPKLDANKIGAAVREMNFTSTIDPASVAKALNGDAEAFMQVLNGVAQEAFKTSFNASYSSQERILGGYDQSVNARIPKVVGSMESRQLLQGRNRGVEHPAISPLVETTRQRFQERYPDATPQEIATAADSYLLESAKLLIAGQSESGNANAGGGEQSQSQSRGKGSIVTDFENFEKMQ